MKAFKVLVDVLEVVIDDKAKKFEIVVPFHFQVGTDFVFRVKKLPIWMTFVLSRLADSPEISLKPSIYHTQARSELSVRSIVSIVSSAKV